MDMEDEGEEGILPRKRKLDPKEIEDDKVVKKRKLNEKEDHSPRKKSQTQSLESSLEMDELDELEDDGDGDEYEFDEDDAFFPDVSAIDKSRDFEVVDMTKLVNEQHTKILNVAETLDISTGTAASLLKFFRWDIEKLYADFFDRKEDTCKKAGISLIKMPFFKGSGDCELSCPICYDDLPSNEMFSLSCKHFFCKGCWGDYLAVKINDGYECLLARCPMRSCDRILSEELVQKIVSPELYKTYSKYVARSFVDDNPRIKWCPAQNCGKAVYVNSTSSLVSDDVICICGQKFCFKCQNEAHAPCSCKDLSNWKLKEKDESESANWLTANTKLCTKCEKPIEKNGGCNHMTCSQCKHEFCWVCLEDWKSHGSQTGGFYSCNKFSKEELEEKTNVKSRNDARAALERYMHYFKRYANHAQSQKFEKQLMQKAEENMREFQRINKYSSWIDVEFIQKAVSQLIDCRNTLKYTYIFAFYLNDDSDEKGLFEFLQQQLEQKTEMLSEILEGPIEGYKRENILSTTKNAELRLRNLLDGCKRGLKNLY